MDLYWCCFCWVEVTLCHVVQLLRIMWTGFGIEWLWIVSLVVTLGKGRGVSYTLYNLGNIAGTCGESRLYLCWILYRWICMQIVIYPPYSYTVCQGCQWVWLHRLVDCYSMSATISIFPEQCCLICAFISVRIYVCIYDGVKTNIVGRPGFFDLNAAILSSFGWNAIVVVLRWFLFVKLVKPPGYCNTLEKKEKRNCGCCLKWFCLSSIRTVC